MNRKNIPVRILSTGQLAQLELFEVAPGVHVCLNPPKHLVPRMGIFKWRAGADNTWTVQVETTESLVPLKHWKENVFGVSKFVIQVLIEAGFVEGARLSPRSLNINLDSFMTFCEAMKKDPYFWQDEDNRRAYKLALARIQQNDRKSQRRRNRQKRDLSPSQPDLL